MRGRAKAHVRRVLMDETPESRSLPGAPAEGESSSRATPQLAELGGDLRCIRCGYNLRGLSIMGTCPECNTPIRATLLYAVDPRADELQPIRRPKVLATALVLWSAGAFLAAVCVWGLRIADLGDAARLGGHADLIRMGAAFFLALSGLGAVALIHPHRGINLHGRVLAAIAVVLYVPLVYLTHVLHARFDPTHLAPYTNLQQADESRSVLRLATSAIILGILVCVRPNARVLAQRSVIMRKGGTNRQILLGLGGAVMLTMVGDLLHIGSRAMNEPVGGPIFLAGNGLIIAGSLLITFGLASALVDTLRLRRVILDPPLTLRRMIAAENGNGSGGNGTKGGRS